MDLRVNDKRVGEISSSFKKLGLQFFKLIEHRDPQMLSLRKLCRKYAPGKIAALAGVNALISYMLNCTGEDYWREFSEHVSKLNVKIENIKDVVKIVEDFLANSSCNKLYRDAKKRRLRKLLTTPITNRILDENYFIENPGNYWRTIARAIGSNPSSKTVVFSVKMYYYGLEACRSIELTLPMNIPIPVDRRITQITFYSGLVESNDINRLFRKPRIVRRTWSLVGELSRIPPIHFDAALWLSAKYYSRNKSLEDSATEISRELSLDYDKALILLRELFYKLIEGNGIP